MTVTKTQMKTLKDIQNADSDTDLIMSKKDFLLAKSTNEEIIKQLETRIKENLAVIKAYEQKTDGAIKGFTIIKSRFETERQRAEKAESELKSLQEQLEIIKNNKKIKVDTIQPVYKVNDEKLKEGADIIYERHHKKDVDAFLKQFEI